MQNYPDFNITLELLSGVLLQPQILKRQLLSQMYVRKLLLLVCWFFSVIWNISQISVFKTKCELKCQNEFFGKQFLKYVNTSVYFLCFHYWDFSWSFVQRQIVLSKCTSKMCQKMSVIKTNSFDDLKKIVHIGILIHILS